MLDLALTHQKSVLIQHVATVGGWDFTVGVFAQEPGAAGIGTVVLGPGRPNHVQDCDPRNKKPPNTRDKTLINQPHPPCGCPEVTAEA